MRYLGLMEKANGKASFPHLLVQERINLNPVTG